jgi:tripartite-type tricarboxylate transporter receptor subunit TctC
LKLLVPFPLGGQVDLYARLLQPQLSEQLGQPVIIDNRPGAGGTIAEAALVAAPADGYTLLLSGDSVPASPHLYANLKYDAMRDLLPVARLFQVPFALVTPPTVMARSAREWINASREDSGARIFATAGPGTNSHLAAAHFARRSGIPHLIAHYKGGGPALADIAAGRVHAMFLPLTLALPQIRAGRVHAIGVTTVQRSVLLPDVPALAEGGFDAAVRLSWSGLFMASGTAAPVVATVRAALSKALQAPALRSRMQELGVEIVDGDTASFAALLRAEHEVFGRLIREAGIDPGAH